jgi:hypothetical protein
MSAVLRALLNKIDAVPERALLWVNTGLSCLIGLAHGGALAMTYAKPIPDVGSIRQIAAISLPIASVVLVTSLTALARPDFGRIALALHGWIFAAAAVVTLFWATSLLIRGIPETNFVWSVGFRSALVVYAFFIASRYGIPKHLRENLLIFYAPLLALVVALPIDVGVFIKAMSEITRRFG